MRRVVSILGVTCAVGLVSGVIGLQGLTAQQRFITRTDVLKTGVAGMEGKAGHRWLMGQDETPVPATPGHEVHMWIAEMPPGAATGTYTILTPRFVYVLAGAVTVEAEGQAPQTFTAGQGFQERPEVRHALRNASTTEPAKTLGLRITGQCQPLQ